MTTALTIRGARLHNLKNVTLTIPGQQLVVLTGPSGSGKSTPGFDILRAQGQRQYLEALGVIPFGMARPPVEAISGLSPTVSVDQYLTNRSPRSTVGTTSDIYTYLRVLFARLGQRPCPACGQQVPPCADLAGVAWGARSRPWRDRARRHFPARTVACRSRRWIWPISRSISRPGPARPVPGWV
ncbi:MAG TPA: hypothetical protein VGF67_04795 [Ktedonobacteraceae bacterium]|jgi:excinuclease ABC subunit A